MRTVGRTSVIALGVALLAVLLGIACFTSDKADASPEIVQAYMEPTSTQAGGHPDARIFTEFGTRFTPPSAECGCEDARTVISHFPTGFIGNPHAISKCEFAQFMTGHCPSDSQVGVVTGVYLFDPNAYVPMYNMETHPDQAGLNAFMAPLVNAAILLDLEGRTESDYGLDVTGEPIYHLLPVHSVDVWLWGVPALPSHDSARFITPAPPGALGACFGPYPKQCVGETGASSNLEPAPYLQNPTSCGVPLTSRVDMEWYGGTQLSAESPWPATTGCDLLSFDPSLTAEPTTTSADTAAGLDVDVKVPQVTSPTTPAPSEIKGVTLTLPKGFTVNPNAADGKVTCSDVESSVGTRQGSRCPEFSKIGTTELDSSALPAPIKGAIFLGEPKSGDKYRLLVTADGFGTHVKLPASVILDRETGQSKTVFTDLPQSPFSEFDLHFFGSERGLLATPTQCGTYEVKADFVPWDSVLHEQHTTSYFTIDSGPNGRPCPNGDRPFDPRFEAGTLDNTAGRYAPLVVRVSRDDGDQNLAGLDVTTPPGLLASLRGLTYCPESALATLASSSYSGLAELVAPACPATSHVGSVVAEAGAGTHPLTTPGQVYLAGPYKGAPLSLLVVVPAVSGPYDLGNAVTRVAIYVDPVTARVTAVSDPLPQIVEGIPLRTRSIVIRLDRTDAAGNSRFTVNPTNCSPFAIGATIHGDQNAKATRSSRFQVANCADLPFGPKLGLRLTGGVKRRGHPAIHALLEAKPGEANLSRVQVTLPKGELLDNSHIGTVCTRVRFAARECPKASLLGNATVTTPLLDEPLRGSVYLRSSSHDLPDVALDLRGQFDIETIGRIDSIKGGLRTTFEAIPDAPVSKIEFNLAGGSKGLLVNSESLCGRAGAAKVTMTGQNGVAADSRARLKAACPKASKRPRRHSGSTEGR
jgi:hypothetical protein